MHTSARVSPPSLVGVHCSRVITVACSVSFEIVTQPTQATEQTGKYGVERLAASKALQKFVESISNGAWYTKVQEEH